MTDNRFAQLFEILLKVRELEQRRWTTKNYYVLRHHIEWEWRKLSEEAREMIDEMTDQEIMDYYRFHVAEKERRGITTRVPLV